MTPRFLAAPLMALILAACGTAPVAPPSAGHLQGDTAAAVAVAKANIPQPVLSAPTLAKPRPAPKVETYSVVVNNVRVQDLLFALARDAKVNVDIHPGINGVVTLNAIDQTLQQILTRIARQVDMRWEFDGLNVSVMADKPYLKTYQIDFLNMTREVQSTIATSTQIASAVSTGSGSGSGSAGGSGGNTATTSVLSKTENRLMNSLIKNVTDMLLEEDRLRYRAQIDTEAHMQAKSEGAGQVAAAQSSGGTTQDPSGRTTTDAGGIAVKGAGNQSADARTDATKKIGEYEKSISVFANNETGVLIVRATSRQHEKVQQFLDQVMRNAKRQVLIEATIVEVALSDGYKQGINWSALPLGSKGFSLVQAPSAGLPSANPLNLFTLAYKNATSSVGNIAAEISLLESFGNVRVLSSPKLSVMNNQTATLKVADSKIYFTVKADTVTNVNLSTTTYTTTPNAVSVGFVLNVTPQISDANDVTLNIRPTITRITGYVNDPNPSLAAAGVVNQVPEIQTREMESIIRIPSGTIAVMGGLMQDELNNQTDAVPAVSSIPVFGNIFRHQNDKFRKTELVIFLRPVVITDASIEGDFAAFRANLPNEAFFGKGIGANADIGIGGARAP